jgi:hypothetical protein
VFSGCRILSTPLGAEEFCSPIIHNSELEIFWNELDNILNLEVPSAQEIIDFSESKDIKRWSEKNSEILRNRLKLIL